MAQAKPPIEATGSNTFHKNSYKELDKILETVTPELQKLGFIIYQSINDGNVITVLYNVDLDCATTSEIPLDTTLDAQKIGSQITYFRRYSILTMLGYTTGKDDDGNEASGVSEKTETTKSAKNKKESKPMKSRKLKPTKENFEAFRNVLSKTEGELIIHQYKQDFAKKYEVDPNGQTELDAIVQCRLEELS